MENLAKIHDKALEYENYISYMAEKISETRIKMYEEKKLNILKGITKQLDEMIYYAEAYKSWLKDLECQNDNSAN